MTRYTILRYIFLGTVLHATYTASVTCGAWYLAAYIGALGSFIFVMTSPKDDTP